MTLAHELAVLVLVLLGLGEVARVGTDRGPAPVVVPLAALLGDADSLDEIVALADVLAVLEGVGTVGGLEVVGDLLAFRFELLLGVDGALDLNLGLLGLVVGAIGVRRRGTSSCPCRCTRSGTRSRSGSGACVVS